MERSISNRDNKGLVTEFVKNLKREKDNPIENQEKM